jgi:hypothetical protein
MLTKFENFINEGYITSNKTLVTVIKKYNSLSSTWFRIGDYVRISGDVDEKIYKITKAFNNPSNKNFNTSFMYQLNDSEVWKHSKELDKVPDEEISGLKYNL